MKWQPMTLITSICVPAYAHHVRGVISRLAAPVARAFGSDPASSQAFGIRKTIRLGSHENNVMYIMY